MFPDQAEHSDGNGSDCLFVYGTLRAQVEHPLHALIVRHTRSLGPAVFQGTLYDLGDYPGVLDSSKPEDLVYGELYQFRDRPDSAGSRALLHKLDAYEECGPGFAEPTEYLRVVRPVRRPGSFSAPASAQPDAEYRAWLYLYNHSVERGRRLPHGDFLRR